MKGSLAHRIALRFFLVIALLILILSLALVGMLNLSMRWRRNRELLQVMQHIARSVQDDGIDSLPALEAELPYYIAYTVYSIHDGGTEEILATNDPFIPILPQTEGRSKTYFKRDYYTDGDLHVLYVAGAAASVIVQVSLSLDQNEQAAQLRSIPGALAFVFVPLLLFSYLAAYLIARRTLRPIVQMTRTAASISATRLDTMLPVTEWHDELDDLAATFNELFVRLRQEFARERQFTSDVSHELKTPLAVIMGEARLLQRWAKSDPAVIEKSTKALVEETRSMEAIINKLLQLSRLENKLVTLEKDEVPLKLLFERLAEHTASWAPESVLDYAAVPDSLCALTDGEALSQVFTVLVSNSVKFAGQEVRITISAAQQGDAVVIRYADDGPGIAADVLPHVFERFYRGDASHSRTASGSGLGLAIAEQIMRVLGGAISASSLAPPDHGAVFTLRLPSAL